MKNLSFWAKENRVKTIIILVILHFILFWIYYFTGAYLYIQEIILPANLKYVGALLFFTALLFYPKKNVRHGIFKNTYVRRKFWQGVALSSVAIFIVLLGNHQARNLLRINQSVEFSAQTIALDIKKETKANKKLSRRERRKLRRTFRKDVRKKLRQMRRANREYSKGEKFGIIMFTLIVALLLLYGLLALSCSISCSGAEGLALIVAVGGLGLVVFGVVKIFRKFGIMESVKKTRPVNNGGG